VVTDFADAARAGRTSESAARVIGMALARAGRYDVVAAIAEASAAAHPRSWSAHHLLGNAWIAIGRTEEGRAELAAALSLAPVGPALAYVKHDVESAG
jgi:Flp pilus assembly protein TadD